MCVDRGRVFHRGIESGIHDFRHDRTNEIDRKQNRHCLVDRVANVVHDIFGRDCDIGYLVNIEIMEGIKQTFNATVDNDGNLRLVMVELREFVRKYPNTRAILTVEILNAGDVEIMGSWYRNHVLPRVVVAWREIGEYYTDEQADRELRRLTTVCHKSYACEKTLIEFDDLDREQRKRYLDEVKLLCVTHLNCIL